MANSFIWNGSWVITQMTIISRVAFEMQIYRILKISWLEHLWKERKNILVNTKKKKRKLEYLWQAIQQETSTTVNYTRKMWNVCGRRKRHTSLLKKHVGVLAERQLLYIGEKHQKNIQHCWIPVFVEESIKRRKCVGLSIWNMSDLF